MRADDAAATVDVEPKPDEDERPKRGIRRTWAELLARTFRIDVLACPDCGGSERIGRFSHAESLRNAAWSLGRATLA